MRKGWRRLGIVISIAWSLVICGYATYEWQAPFYQKSVFFIIVPHPEFAAPNEAIPVTTPFLTEWFVSVLAFPLAALWVVLLIRPAITWVRAGFKA